MDDTTEVAPGVTKVECSWGHWYEGKKEDLIEYGFAFENWFAKPTRDKFGRVHRSKRFKVQGQLIETTLPARGRATVSVHCTDQYRYQFLSLGMVAGVKSHLRMGKPRNDGEAFLWFKIQCMALADRRQSNVVRAEVENLYRSDSSGKGATNA